MQYLLLSHVNNCYAGGHVSVLRYMYIVYLAFCCFTVVRTQA